jgi:hypothetical protein
MNSKKKFPLLLFRKNVDYDKRVYLPISRVNVQVKKMTKYNFGFEEEEEDCYCDDCECEDCEDEE